MIPTTELDATELRKAFSAFPTGVVALAGTVDGEPTVLVASSFAVGVSQDPPLVMFAVQHSSTTWPVLRKRRRWECRCSVSSRPTRSGSCRRRTRQLASPA